MVYPFWGIFCLWCEVEIKFPLQVDIQFSQDDLLKILSLLSCPDS